MGGHLGTIISALLVDDIYGPDLTNHDVKHSKEKCWILMEGGNEIED